MNGIWLRDQMLQIFIKYTEASGRVTNVINIYASGVLFEADTVRWKTQPADLVLYEADHTIPHIHQHLVAWSPA